MPLPKNQPLVVPRNQEEAVQLALEALADAHDAIVKALNQGMVAGDFFGVHMKLAECLMQCFAVVDESSRTPPPVVRAWPPYMRVRDAMGELAVAMEAFDAAVKALPTNRKR